MGRLSAAEIKQIRIGYANTHRPGGAEITRLLDHIEVVEAEVLRLSRAIRDAQPVLWGDHEEMKEATE